MSDARVVIDHLRLHYEGPMQIEEFLRGIDRFFKERGYDKNEPQHYESHTDDGMSIDLHLRPWKKVTNDMRFIIDIRFKFEQLNPIKVPHQKKEILNGKVTIWIDGILESDYEHRWENRPMLQFVRWLFDRFFYLSYTERFEQRLTSEVHKIYAFMEQYFNMTRTHYKPTNLPRF